MLCDLVDNIYHVLVCRCTTENQFWDIYMCWKLCKLTAITRKS